MVPHKEMSWRITFMAHAFSLKSSRTINIQGAKQYQFMNLKVIAILLAWLFTGKVVAPVGCQYRPYTVCQSLRVPEILVHPRESDPRRVRTPSEKFKCNDKPCCRSQCFAVRPKLAVFFMSAFALSTTSTIWQSFLVQRRVPKNFFPIQFSCGSVSTDGAIVLCEVNTLALGMASAHAMGYFCAL